MYASLNKQDSKPSVEATVMFISGRMKGDEAKWCIDHISHRSRPLESGVQHEN